MARLVLVAHALCLLAVVLALTVKTLSLDDIKKTVFWIAGPLLMLLGIAAFALRQAIVPPRAIVWGFGGFALVLLISALLSAFHWVGFEELLMFYSAGGFMLSAIVIAAYRRTAEIFFRFLVLMLLATNLIGIFLYDFAETDPATGSLAKWMAGRLLDDNPGAGRSWWGLLLTTFSIHEGAMQSTILSRDFYAGFCICFLPFAMLLMLDPGAGRRRRFWRAVAGLTTLLTLVCVLKAQSKGEYLVGAVMVCLFFALIFYIEDLPLLRSRAIVGLLAGIGIVMAVVLWMMQPVLVGKLKSMDTSIGSREIIWQGAWNVFKERPVLGGGPGTFRIYFPRERMPDYYEHEIANVTLYSHNYFLDLLSETGLLGFGFFAWALLATAVLGAWLMLRHPDGRLRVMLLAALCGLLAIFGSNLSSPNGRWPVGAASLYTVLGIAIGLIAQARASSPHPSISDPNPNRLRRWAWGALLIFAAAMPWVGGRAGWRYFNSRAHHLIGFRESNAAQAALDGTHDDIAAVRSLFARAIAAYNESLHWLPANYQSLYQLGYLHTRLAEVEAEQLRALMLRDSVAREAVEGLAVRMSDDLRRAIRQYERLARLWPDYAEIHYNLGFLYGKAAQTIRMAESLGLESAFPEHDAAEWERMALEQCQTQAAMSNRDAVKLLLAQQYTQLERFDEAIAVLREAARMFPENRQILQEYHNVAMRAGDTAAQCEALELLTAREPLNDARLDLLLNLTAEKRYDRLLLKTLERLEEKNPVDPRIAQYRFRLAAERGDAAKAREQLIRYRRSGGSDEIFLRQVGDFLGREAALSVPATSQNR